MPAFQVNKTIVINAPIATLRESLMDYKQWPSWSPWLITEPQAQVNYNDKQGQVGAAYDWQGNMTGEGEMKLTKASDNALEMDLTFLKPFKSSAKVGFDLIEQGESTEVTWRMKSQLPFFMFWMVNKMKMFIGMDYERGLRMLKDHIETGSVPSKISLEGKFTLAPQKYIGIANSCQISEIGEVMPADFQAVSDYLKGNNIISTGTPFAIYTIFDFARNHVEFVSAIPIDNAVSAPAPFVVSELQGGDALKVKHIGNYEHVGNAWSLAIGHARHNKIKVKKTPVGIEFYLNDPTTTAPKDLTTDVVLLLK